MVESSSPGGSKSGPPAAFEVHYVLKEFRPDVSSSDYGEEDDTVWVTSVGDPFMYVIPMSLIRNDVKNNNGRYSRGTLYRE